MFASGGNTPYIGVGTFTNQLPGPQNYIVTDANGCITSASITLVDPPQIAIGITTINSTCGLNNGSATATATAGFAPYSYFWSPGSQSTATIGSLAAGNYTVTVTDVKGCTSTVIASIANSGNIPVIPTAINGPSGGCRTETGVVYSVDAVPGATSYTWTKPSGVSGTSTSNSITVSFSNSYNGGNLSVKANNSCGSSANQTLNITRYTTGPATPGVISGTGNICGPQTSVYSIAPVPNATDYTWSIFGIGGGTSPTIVSGQGTNTISINYPSGYIAGIIFVQASNCAGNSGYRIKISGGVLVLPPIFISAPTSSVCAGSTKTYSLLQFPNAESYTWNAPPGAIISDGLGATGNPLTVDSSVVSVDITYPAGFVSGQVSVYASNACGDSPVSTRSISSSINNPGSISGPTTGLCGASNKSYSIAPVWGATSYSWSVPSGATINGSSSGNSINVNFGPGFNGTGNISVTANNSCGASVPSSITLNSVIGNPGSISGSTTGLCGASGKVYSISSVTGASTYIWTVPAGATINGSSTGNSISVSYGSGFDGTGVITVTASGGCGLSTTSSLTLNSGVPNPGAISGPETNLCLKTKQKYSISTVPGATSYTWTIPSGTSFSGSSTGKSIKVNFGSGFTGTGIISVVANSACGSSAPSMLTVDAGPDQPGNISGNSTVCKSNSNVTYSISSVTGASSYTWTISGGATFVGSTTGTTVKVKFTTATTSLATLTVKANNACGSSSITTKSINVNLGCREMEELSNQEPEVYVNVYPNPSKDRVTLDYSALANDNHVVIVMDAYGKIVVEKSFIALEDGINSGQLDISQLSSGIYFVQLQKEGSLIKVVRLVVQH